MGAGDYFLRIQNFFLVQPQNFFRNLKMSLNNFLGWGKFLKNLATFKRGFGYAYVAGTQFSASNTCSYKHKWKLYISIKRYETFVDLNQRNSKKS